MPKSSILLSPRFQVQQCMHGPGGCHAVDFYDGTKFISYGPRVYIPSQMDQAMVYVEESLRGYDASIPTAVIQLYQDQVRGALLNVEEDKSADAERPDESVVGKLLGRFIQLTASLIERRD